MQARRVAEHKEPFFLLTLSLSGFSLLGFRGHDIAVKQNGRAEEVLRSLQIWGVASALLATFVLFPTLHSLYPAEATRSAQFDIVQNYHSRFTTLPSFREAPWFRNGKNCVSNSNATESEFICDPASVHIAMTLDSAYSRGSMAAVHSILQHASCPENIIFHFLVSHGESEFQSLIGFTFPHLKFKIYHFDENLVKERISSSVRQALEQPLNYARNYLADILEVCVQRVLYLDSDLIVVDDIAELWGTSLESKALGAPEYCQANFTKYFTSSFWSERDLSSTFADRFPCYFNTGVMIMDLVKWRQNKYTREVERWMEIQKERRIYELGSLPPFLLVFAGLVEPVSHRWNQHGLGGDNVKGSCRPLHPGPVSLLHWSGTGKPWLRLDSKQPCPLDTLWAPYDLYVPPCRSESRET